MNTDRPAYKPFEARLIQHLKERFEKVALEVEDHLKVGNLPLEIDMVVKFPRSDWQPDFTKFPRLFDYFRQHNVIEIKTEQDRFELEDLLKLLAYGWLYMARAGLENVHEVSVTALVHHLTPRMRGVLSRFGFTSLTPEVYRRNTDMIAYVIAFAGLPDERLPEELQAFADPVRRQKIFLSSLGDQEKSSLVETIIDLYESEVGKFMLNIREESLRKILSALGENKIISTLGEEKVISALGEEKVISALGEEKVVDAFLRNASLLKLLMAKLDAEQLRQMLEEKSHN